MYIVILYNPHTMHYAVLNESISYTGKIHHPETTTTTHSCERWGLGVVPNFKCT